MKPRWRWILFALLVAVGLTWGVLPTALRAIPSRYVARLPAPVQALGQRDHVAALPTVGAPDRSAQLLLADVAMAADPPTLAPPAITVVEPTALPPADPPATESVPSSATLQPTAMPPPTPAPTALPAQVRLAPVYHQFQDWNNCGPATLAMALSYFGIGVSQYDVAAVVKPNPEDRNVSPEEMAAYVAAETDLAALARVNGTLPELRALLAAGFPVIVELGLDPPGEYAWMDWYGHYLLVVAYDDAVGQFWVYDSWMGTSEVPGENADNRGRQVSYEELDRYWRQFSRSYITLYPPEENEVLQSIVGPNMDDGVMWQSALDRARQETQAEPEDAFLWFNLGTALTAAGQHEDAAAAFDRARDIGLPWRMLWYQFGPFRAYLETGRYAEVILLADINLEDRPYFEESYYYRGEALAALGRTAEARRDLERALTFNPNFAPARQALAALDTGG